MKTVRKATKLKMFRALFGMVTAAFSLYVAYENFRKLQKGTTVTVE